MVALTIRLLSGLVKQVRFRGWGMLGLNKELALLLRWSKNRPSLLVRSLENAEWRNHHGEQGSRALLGAM